MHARVKHESHCMYLLIVVGVAYAKIVIRFLCIRHHDVHNGGVLEQIAAAHFELTGGSDEACVIAIVCVLRERDHRLIGETTSK